MARIVDLRDPGSASEALRPIKPATGKGVSPVRCTLKVGDDGKPLLGLSYTVGDRWSLDHRVEEVVRLQTTRPNFGGVRWWFSCPHTVDDKECGRRIGKLYCTLGSRYFACRHCLDLTYESCQKSHRYDELFALDWYFHFRQGGRQRTKYLGQTDNPEARVDELVEEDNDEKAW